jgi:hypothetical protein
MGILHLYILYLYEISSFEGHENTYETECIYACRADKQAVTYVCTKVCIMKMKHMNHKSQYPLPWNNNSNIDGLAWSMGFSRDSFTVFVLHR